MKIQVQIPNNNIDSIKDNLSCDAGQITSTWTDTDGNSWMLIDVHPDRQKEIEKILKRPTYLSM